MDNSNMDTVRAFAASFDAPKLDLLVCNAGIMNTSFALSDDGHGVVLELSQCGLGSHPKMERGMNAFLLLLTIK